MQTYKGKGRMMKRTVFCLLCLLPVSAGALENGERLQPWTLLDQHDQTHTLND